MDTQTDRPEPFDTLSGGFGWKSGVGAFLVW